jgi:hypothetical protein
MPASPTQPSPQPAQVEPTHEGLPVAAEQPHQAPPGTLPDTAMATGLQRTPSLESILDALGEGTMTENTVPNDPPPSTTPRAANNQTQTGPSRRHVRPVFPDPVIAAPNAPRAVAPPSPTANQQRLTIAGRILVFFGYGRNNRARKELVSVISSIVVDLSQVSMWLVWLSNPILGLMGRMVRFGEQIIAIIALLTISTHHRSPTEPSKNEWDACGKPLGTWDALWVVRLALDIWLSVWRWSRERTKRLQDER